MYIIVVYETQQLLEFVEKNFDPGWKPTQGKPVSLPDGIVFILKKMSYYYEFACFYKYWR